MEDVESLSGRDLDAMVAQHVFGLLVGSQTNTRTGKQEYVCAIHPGSVVQVAYYSSTMSASLTLEVELKRRGWERVLDPWSHPGDQGVVLMHTDGRRVEAPGSLREALCRAALKALL